jgi:hypothetical protein
MLRSLHCDNTGIIAGLAMLGCIPAFTQVLDLEGGPAGTGVYWNRVLGGAQQTIEAQSSGVTFYTANYTALKGGHLAFNIVGTDPALGANTTNVPTVLVPLKFVFPQTGSPTLDGTNVITAVQNSPMFLTADYTVGGTDLGTTQFGDALQRGQFWNLPGFSLSYHVLLGTPTVAPTVTVNVPAGQGSAFRLRNGGLLGAVRESFFDAVLAGLLPSYTANQLPIFMTDNVFLSPGGGLAGCCVLGFHNSQSGAIATAKTWIYSAYTEPGTFVGDVILDVQPLSHEVAEWLNDPFVGAFPGLNLIPPAVLPGTGGSCIINLETGDPLESPPIAFTKVTNGTTYHLQDEVFMTWYLHSMPSFSVNNWYTLINSFPSFSRLCGPG